MFSMVTVASSTRMPTASAKPPSVMMLKVSPRKLSIMTDVRIDNGMEIAMMTVLRQFPRNSKIIRPVRHAAITASRITPLIDPRTKIDCSALSILSDDIGLRGKAVADVGNVAKVDRRIPDDSDRKIVQFGHSSRAGV